MKYKKALGQNFLTNTDIVAAIAQSASIDDKDTILEIGPGKGILTAELLKRGAKVVAVEKDADLIPFLNEKFKNELKIQQFTLINADILETEPEKIIPSGKPYKIVANIPYYITGQIIRKFLTAKNKPEKMALLVQKEVAERIIAKDQKESLLSISVKAYGTPKYIKTVKAGAFTPAPKVDSAILLIEKISGRLFEKSQEKRFFEILHAGFAHKRKQMQSNMKITFQEKTPEILTKCGIRQNERPENLSVENWFCLSGSYNEKER